MLNPKLFKRINEHFNYEINLDLFADSANHQVERYATEDSNDHSATYLDAFSIKNWGDGASYANPPFSLYRKILDRLEKRGETIILLIPVRLETCWYNKALSMLCEDPIEIPHSKHTFTSIVNGYSTGKGKPPWRRTIVSKITGNKERQSNYQRSIHCRDAAHSKTCVGHIGKACVHPLKLSFPPVSCNALWTTQGPQLHIIDSGANISILRDEELFDSLEDTHVVVQTANRATSNLIVRNKGTARIKLLNGDEIIITNAYFSKEIPANILSLNDIEAAGWTFNSTQLRPGTLINNDSGTEITCEKQNGLHYLRTRKNIPDSTVGVTIELHHQRWGNELSASIVESTSSDDHRLRKARELHERLGHTNLKRIKYMIKHSTTRDLGDDKLIDFGPCRHCIEGKANKRKFDQVKVSNTKPGKLLHIDLADMTKRSTYGNYYFLLIIDDWSRYSWALPTRTKSQSTDKAIKLIKDLQEIYEFKVKRIRIDRGELMNARFADFCNENGTRVEATVRKTPQSDGTSERHIQ
jgi:hypothetical protein